MKLFLLFITITTSILAQEFYSKLHPIATYEVKSSVSGKVVSVFKQFEMKHIKNAMVIKIDDEVNQIDLEQSKIKLKNLQEVLKLQEETLESYNKVSSKSKVERDAQKIQVLNTASTISDLKTKIATLNNTIANKNIRIKNLYLESIAVEKGDFVNMGSLLYKAYDLSKGKLEIFLPISEVENFKNKTIYIDGKKSDLKLDNISLVADEKHISSYKAEIIIQKPEKISSLHKIEFK